MYPFPAIVELLYGVAEQDESPHCGARYCSSRSSLHLVCPFDEAQNSNRSPPKPDHQSTLSVQHVEEVQCYITTANTSSRKYCGQPICSLPSVPPIPRRPRVRAPIDSNK